MLVELSELMQKYNIKFNGVLHVGANKAQEREKYRTLGLKVIWVEAIPDVFEELKRNISNYHNQTALCACVSDVDNKDVVFNISNNEKQSSSMLKFKVHADIHPDVKFESTINLKTSRIDSIFKTHDFTDWLLNIDIQGAELLALKGAGILLDQFNALYLEVNKKETYEGCALVEDIDDYVSKFSFARVETSQWMGDSWGDAFYIKK